MCKQDNLESCFLHMLLRNIIVYNWFMTDVAPEGQCTCWCTFWDTVNACMTGDISLENSMIKKSLFLYLWGFEHEIFCLLVTDKEHGCLCLCQCKCNVLDSNGILLFWLKLMNWLVGHKLMHCADVDEVSFSASFCPFLLLLHYH